MSASQNELMGSIPEALWVTGSGLPDSMDEIDPQVLRRSVLWVAENLLVKNVKPKDAPSRFAWTLLLCMRAEYPDSMKQLYSLIAKLFPSKREIDEADARQLSDRSVDKAIRAAERAAKVAEAFDRR